MTLLLAPGPMAVPQIVKDTFQNDPPYFASSEFSDLLEYIQPELRCVFKSGHFPVLIGCGSGSLGLQSTISNFFSPGAEVLVVSMGKYGDLWARMAVSHRLSVSVAAVPHPGMFVEPDHLKTLLTSKTRGVLITHTETTTGTTCPLEEYVKVIRENSDALICVDAVSSLLTEPLVSSDCDVVISASQKALLLPPGMFFMMVSDKAAKILNESAYDVYFQVCEELERNKKNITTFTPPSFLIPALKVALDQIREKQGVDMIVSQTEIAAGFVQDRLELAGYKLVSNHPSNCVTAIWTKDCGRKLRLLSTQGIVVGDGVGHLKGEILRLAHMGWDLNRASVYHVCDLLSVLY